MHSHSQHARVEGRRGTSRNHVEKLYMLFPSLFYIGYWSFSLRTCHFAFCGARRPKVSVDCYGRSVSHESTYNVNENDERQRVGSRFTDVSTSGACACAWAVACSASAQWDGGWSSAAAGPGPRDTYRLQRAAEPSPAGRGAERREGSASARPARVAFQFFVC